MAGALEDGESTWEIPGAARRPGIDDFGGAQDVDQDPAPPDTQWSAGKSNFGQRNGAAMAGVVPSAIVWWSFSGATPQIDEIKACSGLLTIASFTPTLIGTGQLRIAWTAGDLPPIAGPGCACKHEAGDMWVETVSGDVNALDVFMTDLAGTPANLAGMLFIY